MRSYSLAVFAVLLGTQLVSAQVIRAVDEAGKPIDKFEAMYHTADQGYSHWEAARDGQCTLHFGLSREPTLVDVLVRSDGYATAVKQFRSDGYVTVGKQFSQEEGEQPSREGETITLVKGRSVKLQLDLPEGTKLPEGVMPETYFANFAERVRMMWQPSNQHGERRSFNLLNLQTADDGSLKLQLPDEPSPFYIAFDQPGWLRFCELGPFTKRHIEGGSLRVPVPAPSTIEVRFSTGSSDPSDLPFEEAACSVMWKNPDGPSGSYYSVTGADGKLTDGKLRVTDLGPGDYLVQVRTSPKANVVNLDGTEINPGKFFDQREVTLVAGEKANVKFKYEPFDPESYRGTAKARIALLRADGEPAAGKPVKVEWFDGHYGSINVLDGSVPDDGVVSLEGVSSKTYPGSTMGSYTVKLDDERIGFFGLKETDELQKFEFRVAPKAGDVAPDFSFVNLETEEVRHLADLKGKIVLVEFWATWCGPCQPAMAKLVENYAAHEQVWKDDVVVLALSTDDRRELAKRHVEARAWNSMPQYWASRPSGERFSDVELAYVVHGIPHAILIDAEGKIAWRGHPMANEDDLDVVGRIEALRKQ